MWASHQDLVVYFVCSYIYEWTLFLNTWENMEDVEEERRRRAKIDLA